jgi:hypothetical protein
MIQKGLATPGLALKDDSRFSKTSWRKNSGPGVLNVTSRA